MKNKFNPGDRVWYRPQWTDERVDAVVSSRYGNAYTFRGNLRIEYEWAGRTYRVAVKPESVEAV